MAARNAGSPEGCVRCTTHGCAGWVIPSARCARTEGRAIRLLFGLLVFARSKTVTGVPSVEGYATPTTPGGDGKNSRPGKSSDSGAPAGVDRPGIVSIGYGSVG
jgi:hypothetical protein